MSDEEKNGARRRNAAGVRSWLARLARSRHALALMTALSFLEATILPVPLEFVLVPYMAANRERVWLIATMVLLGHLAAAVVGYLTGVFLFETVGQWLIETFGYQEAFESFQRTFAERGFIAILLVGITPVPFEVAMLVAGLTGYPFLLFIAAAAIARSIRYYGLALLVLAFGDRIGELWTRHRRSLTIVILVAAALALAALFVL